MKKTYKAPKYKTIDLTGEEMIAGSPEMGGVTDGSKTIDEYTSTDVSYVKGHSAWDDEW